MPIDFSSGGGTTGTIEEITSEDGSVTIVNPTGAITDLSTSKGTIESITSSDGTITVTNPNGAITDIVTNFVTGQCSNDVLVWDSTNWESNKTKNNTNTYLGCNSGFGGTSTNSIAIADGLKSASGQYNIGIGGNSMFNSHGSDNIGIGNDAGSACRWN